MIVEVVGWDGEDRRVRLFDLPDVTVEALQAFVASGHADGELAVRLEDLRTDAYAAIAGTPMSQLDEYYRERLAAMHVWEHLTDSEITAGWTVELPLR